MHSLAPQIGCAIEASRKPNLLQLSKAPLGIPKPITLVQRLKLTLQFTMLKTCDDNLHVSSYKVNDQENALVYLEILFTLNYKNLS